MPSHTVSYHGTITARRSLDCRKLTRPGVFYVAWPLTLIRRLILVYLRDRWWTAALIRRLRDPNIPPAVSRGVAKIVKHFFFLKVPEYDSHIPPRFNRVWCPGHGTS